MQDIFLPGRKKEAVRLGSLLSCYVDLMLFCVYVDVLELDRNVLGGRIVEPEPVVVEPEPAIVDPEPIIVEPEIITPQADFTITNQQKSKIIL